MPLITLESSQRPYLIDRILPAYAMHLLVGSSGAGKSTLLCQLWGDFRMGKPFFGYKTNPCPVVYISADRTPETTHETIARTGAQINSEDVYCMVDRKRWKWPRSIDGIKAATAKILPQKNDVLIIVDGFTSLFRKPNDHFEVAETLMDITRFLREYRLTMLGVCLIPKVREGERIADARQQVLGAVTWAAHTETVLLIEPASNKDRENDERRLTILPRNDPTTRFALKFDDRGRLVEAAEEIADCAFDFQLSLLQPGAEFATADLVTWAKNAEVSSRTAHTWINKQMENGAVKRLVRGRYKKEFAV